MDRWDDSLVDPPLSEQNRRRNRGMRDAMERSEQGQEGEASMPSEHYEGTYTWEDHENNQRFGEVHTLVARERFNQRMKWGETSEHDVQHSDFEWLGLIAQYAAAGRYIEAAALCEAAEEARRVKAG